MRNSLSISPPILEQGRLLLVLVALEKSAGAEVIEARAVV
jgi:hypothetical protein